MQYANASKKVKVLNIVERENEHQSFYVCGFKSTLKDCNDSVTGRILKRRKATVKWGNFGRIMKFSSEYKKGKGAKILKKLL